MYDCMYILKPAKLTWGIYKLNARRRLGNFTTPGKRGLDTVGSEIENIYSGWGPFVSLDLEMI